MRGGIWASVFVCAGAVLWSACAAEAASKPKPQITIETVKQAIEDKTGTVQLVTFPDTGWEAVKMVRGGSPVRDKTGQQPAAEKVETAEIVTFADPRSSSVRVLRGDSERGSAMPRQVRPAAMTMQVVAFANLRDRPVSILRGPGLPSATETELFSPASAAEMRRPAASSVSPANMQRAPPMTPSQRFHPAARSSLNNSNPQKIPSRLLAFHKGKAMLNPTLRIA